MEVTIRQEAGYDLALYGFSLSYKDRAIKPKDWWDKPRKERTERAAVANAGRGKGHDKFLRQIMLWIDIEAPRYWWSEMDTYKVGTVAQSESTMHTLSKREMEYGDVQSCLNPEVLKDQVDLFNTARDKSVVGLKPLVPEAYLQRRLVTLNYAVLRCIIEQRRKHRLPEWKQFIKSIYDQVEHPELLIRRDIN